MSNRLSWGAAQPWTSTAARLLLGGVLGASYDDLLEQEVIPLEHEPIAILDGYSTDRCSSRVNSTPTILVEGTPLREWSDEALRTAVSAALSAS